jgi:hypothetical protein
MVAKNRMVGLTGPAIGNQGGDLDHSSVRYRTIEANERLLPPAFTFAVLSGQPTGLGWTEGWGAHAQPDDPQARRLSRISKEDLGERHVPHDLADVLVEAERAVQQPQPPVT